MREISLDKPVRTLTHQTTERRRLIKSKYFWGNIGLFVMVGFILTGGLIIKLANDRDKTAHKGQESYNGINESPTDELQQLLGKYRPS